MWMLTRKGGGPGRRHGGGEEDGRKLGEVSNDLYRQANKGVKLTSSRPGRGAFSATAAFCLSSVLNGHNPLPTPSRT